MPRLNRRRAAVTAAVLAGALATVLPGNPANAATTESSNYVRRTLRVLEGAADPAEVEALATRLENGTSRIRFVVERVGGDAYRAAVVEDLYAELLGRSPDPAGFAGWTRFLDAGDEYGARAGFLGSQEFLARNGGTVRGFVEGVYRTQLGRAGDPAGVDAWVRATTNTAAGRAATATGIMRSVEARRREVRSLYEDVLARSGDAGGVAAFADVLADPRGIESVTVALAASGEAFGQSQRFDQVLLLLPGNQVQRADAETLATAGPPVAFPAVTGTLVSIDVRPFTGVVYGITDAGVLWSLNPDNGTAVAIGTAPAHVDGSAAPAGPTGAALNIDFNPQVDRLRITAAGGAPNNWRANPDSGAAVDGDPNTAGVNPDGALAFAAGDPNAGATPLVVGSAYTSNGAVGAVAPAATTLFDIEAGNDVLVTQDPPNLGLLNTVGPLGVDVVAGAFDISGATGRAWGFLDDGTGFGSYRIDLRTGRAIRQSTTGLTILGAAVWSGTPAEAGEGLLVTSTGLTVVPLASPGTVASSSTFAGLNAATTIVGADLRGATGMVYALGSDGQLYVLGAPKAATPATIPLEKVGAPVAEVAGNPTAAGFDFNPLVDRLRITVGTTNLRVNPNNGVLAMVDGALAYAAGDPGSGVTPDVRNAGYTNVVLGGLATGTQLFDIESNRDVLALQSPPNDGVLVSVGALGPNVGPAAGYDITRGNAGYAVLASGPNAPSLWTVSTATGALAPAGALPPAVAASIVGFTVR